MVNNIPASVAKDKGLYGKDKFPGIVNIGKDIKEKVLYGKPPKYAHVTKSKQREFI